MLFSNMFKDRIAKKIIKNSGVILLGNSAASVLGIISFTIMANSLGPKHLAYFALSQAYVYIVNDIFNVQTWESLLKFGLDGGNEDSTRSIIKTNFVIDLISAFVAFGFALVLLPIVTNLLGWDDALVEITFLYVFIMPFTLTTFTIGVPRLYNKFSFVAKVQFFLAVSKLMMISFLATRNSSAKEFILVYIIVEVLINIILILYSFYLLKKNDSVPWWKARWNMNTSQWKFIWWTNLRTITRIPVRQLDVMVINSVISLEVVGVYKVYKEIVSVVGRLSDPVNQALYPEYAKLIGKDKCEDAVNVTYKILTLLSLVSVSATIVLLLFSKLIVGSLFGYEYLAMLPALYLLIVLSGVNLFLTPVNSLFIVAGFAKFSFYIVLVSNISYLAVVILGGVLWGIYGIVLAFATQMVINQGMKVFLLKKYSTGWSTVVR